MTEPEADLLRWRSAGFRGLVRADWADALADLDPLEWIDQTSVQTLRDRASSRVDRCHTPHGVVLTKVIRGVNDRAAETPSIKSNLKWIGRRSRAVAAMRTSHRMAREDVCCAPIILAGRRREALSAIDVLVSLEVKGPQLREALLEAIDPDDQRALLACAALAIEHLHAQGFLHGDLHLRNILLTGPERQPCFIDNDRTRRWPTPLPWALRRRNLEQMCFRLLRVFPDCNEPFLRAYLDAARIESRRAERTIVRIDAKARRRVEALNESRAQQRAQSGAA